MTENIDQVRELEAEIDRANLRADRRAADLRVRGQQIRELEAENEWLRGHVRNAEDYLRLTHAYPGAGGWHDTLGADFGCGGCKLAQELKDALTEEAGEYRYCGATIDRPDATPYTCARRVAHDGGCTEESDR